MRHLSLLSRTLLTLPTLTAIVVGPAACAPREARPDTTSVAAKDDGDSCDAERKGAHGAHGEGHEMSEEHHEHAAAKPDREAVDADGVVRRGAALSADPAITVADAAGRGAELNGKKVKITGTVSSVCANMGCWMVVAGADPTTPHVRITSKKHDVYFPRGSVGRLATVEGVLEVKVVPQARAQHYEDERELKAGETHKTITGDVSELTIYVEGAELKPAA